MLGNKYYLSYQEAAKELLNDYFEIYVYSDYPEDLTVDGLIKSDIDRILEFAEISQMIPDEIWENGEEEEYFYQYIYNTFTDKQKEDLAKKSLMREVKYNELKGGLKWFKIEEITSN